MALLGNALGREALLFLLALQFLTRLPLPRNLGYSPAQLGAAQRYFPLVGVVVGSIGALVYGAATILRLPQVMAALLATAATFWSRVLSTKTDWPTLSTGLGHSVGRRCWRSCRTVGLAFSGPWGSE